MKTRKADAWGQTAGVMRNGCAAGDAGAACDIGSMVLEQLRNGSGGSASGFRAPVNTAPATTLSVRATNVLKELAAELTGENPPKGPWSPPAELARKLTRKRLMATRNCGPQTLNEIVRWTQLQGVEMQPLFHTGRSLSAMWQDTITRFASGESSKVEILQALEKSMRRRNTRIPVAFQAILLQILTTI